LNGEPNVSGGLISQISSVQTQLDSEVMRAMGAEGVIVSDLQYERDARIMAVADVSSRLDSEVATRQANVVDINAKTGYLEERVNTLTGQHAYQEQRHDDEYQRATAAEAALSASIASSVVEINTRTDNALAEKFDKTGGLMSGDLKVTGELAIGANWKLVTLGSSVEFRYSADGGSESPWYTAIPFFSV